MKNHNRYIYMSILVHGHSIWQPNVSTVARALTHSHPRYSKIQYIFINKQFPLHSTTSEYSHSHLWIMTTTNTISVLFVLLLYSYPVYCLPCILLAYGLVHIGFVYATLELCDIFSRNCD